MLTQNEIRDVARDLSDEAARRSYVSKILAPSLSEEPESWQMIIELVEIVLHGRGFFIVPESMLKTPTRSEAGSAVKP